MEAIAHLHHCMRQPLIYCSRSTQGYFLTVIEIYDILSMGVSAVHLPNIGDEMQR